MAIYMDQAVDSNLNLSDSIMSTKPILFTLRWAQKGLFTYYASNVWGILDPPTATPIQPQLCQKLPDNYQ